MAERPTAGGKNEEENATIQGTLQGTLPAA